MVVQPTGLQGTLNKNETRIMTAIGDGKASIRKILNNGGFRSPVFVFTYLERLIQKGYLCKV